MGRGGKPTIRILILGAPGVGKNCLESRFTTTSYPPLYDPALTLSSRRFFTLSPRPPSPPGPVTRPLDTSDGVPQLPPLRQSLEEDGSFFTLERPGSAESTYSNPSVNGHNNRRHSQRQKQDRQQDRQQDQQQKRQSGWELKRQSAVLPAFSPSPEWDICRAAAGNSPGEDNGPERDPAGRDIERDAELAGTTEGDDEEREPCSDCVREANTYMVEVTNYPSLQLPKVRAQVYKEGEYDAVLLVYDVGSRASFDAVADLHAEIPLHKRRNSSASGGGVGAGSGQLHKRKGSHSALGRRNRSSIWLGGGSVSTTSLAEAIMGGGGGGGGGGEGRNGGGETVVALVGNKADVDAEYGSADLALDDAILMEEKRGVLQEADIEERSLVHPLYRESRVFGSAPPSATTAPEGGMTLEGEDDGRLLRLLPGARESGSLSPLLAPPRSPRSPYGSNNNNNNYNNMPPSPRAEQRKQPLLQPRTARAVPVPGHLRRSVMSSVDHDSAAQRMSVASMARRSVASVQEGKERTLTRLPTRAPKSEAIETWIRTGSPSAVGGDRFSRRIDSTPLEESTTADSEVTTAASRRQVSKLEGQMLSRTLLLNVPFFETSAKTGENVEEVFEAIVREVLREMGKEVERAEYEQCRRKRHEQSRREAARATKTNSKKDADWLEGHDGWPRVELPEEQYQYRGQNHHRRQPEQQQQQQQQHQRVRMALDTTSTWRPEEGSSNDDSPVSTTTSQKGRRESMMARFRRIFMRKSAVMVADVPG